MSISSITKKVDENSAEVSSFLAGKRANDKIQVFQGLQDELNRAIERPDSPPGAARRTVDSQERVEEDGVGVTASRTAPQAGNRNKKMVEKTFSIDKDQYRKLVRFSNLEGLRLDAHVSASEILRHLVDFAIAHVDEKKGEVLPTRDGKGLRIPARRAGG